MQSGSLAVKPVGVDGSDEFAVQLETEGLIILPDRPFLLAADEVALLSPVLSNHRAKNISLAGAGVVRGAAAGAPSHAALTALMERYGRWAEALIHQLAPRYSAELRRGRTSFRTRSVNEPAASARKDDRRLHVDAFASQPTGGRRILRVFSNINPEGQPRIWQVGEPFEAYAGRWLHHVRRPWPGETWALHRLGITKTKRTPYDVLMLALHDAAKLDDSYQRTAPRREVAFPAGASWMVFTDSVVHAAIAGQYALEQTFYLPPAAMAVPAVSPARILERLVGEALC